MEGKGKGTPASSLPLIRKMGDWSLFCGFMVTSHCKGGWGNAFRLLLLICFRFFWCLLFGAEGQTGLVMPFYSFQWRVNSVRSLTFTTFKISPDTRLFSSGKIFWTACLGKTGSGQETKLPFSHTDTWDESETNQQWNFAVRMSIFQTVNLINHEMVKSTVIIHRISIRYVGPEYMIDEGHGARSSRPFQLY